jgi:hypothetical protein
MSHPDTVDCPKIRQRANMLSKRVDVATIIQRENLARVSRIEDAAAKTTENLMAMAFSDVGQVVDDVGRPRKIRDLPEPLRKAITDIEVEGDSIRYKLGGKLKALEILGKMSNLIKEPSVNLNFISEEERNKKILEILTANTKKAE